MNFSRLKKKKIIWDFLCLLACLFSHRCKQCVLMDHICYHRLRLLSDEDLDSISHSYDLTPVCAPLVKPLKSWCTEAFFIYIATLKRLIHKNQCMCCKLSRVIQEGQIILSILKLLTQFLKPLPKRLSLYFYT